MLKLENELSRLRESIEVIAGRQQFLQHVTSTVRLEISLFQVEEETMLASGDASVFTASKAGFLASLKRLKTLGEQGIVLFVTSFPYLLLLALLLGPIYWLARKRIRSVMKRTHQAGDDQTD
jgi:hypothetical protein